MTAGPGDPELRDGRSVVLYDGACPFCRAQLARLVRMVGTARIEALDLHDPTVPLRFPELKREALISAMHLVDPRGRVFTGFHAVVRAVASRPVLGKVALLYYLPGIRQLAEWIYRRVADRRFRLLAESCPDGACSLHMVRSSDSRDDRMRR